MEREKNSIIFRETIWFKQLGPATAVLTPVVVQDNTPSLGILVFYPGSLGRIFPGRKTGGGALDGRASNIPI
jgi:hypothetical protein